MFLVMKVAQLNKTKTIKCLRKPGKRYLDLYQVRVVRLRESIRAQSGSADSGSAAGKEKFSAAEGRQGLVMERL
jgi:hypothetical protein